MHPAPAEACARSESTPESLARTLKAQSIARLIERNETLDRSHARSARDADSSERDAQLFLSRPLGDYVPQQLIGAGAMGLVFRARHRHQAHEVALKVMRPAHVGSSDHLRRWLSEAQAIARVRSDRVVQVHDVDVEADGVAWLAMELLDGSPLSALIPGRGLPARRGLALGIQLCQVLEEIHDAGVVHRDIKPANLFVTRKDGRAYLKALDFGLAQVLDDADELAGLVMGSPPYMAPEQVLAEATDARTDIYALGCVLWELLSGSIPFEHDSVPELLHASVHGAVPCLSQARAIPPLIAADLDALIARCLAKAPSARPGHPSLVRSRLAHLQGRLHAH